MRAGIILVLLAILFATLAWANGHLGDYYLRLISLVGINIILAASLNLTNGFTGVFSLGHAAFMAVGAYASAILTYPPDRRRFTMPALAQALQGVQWDLLSVLIVAGLAAALVAVMVGWPVLRLRGHYLAVATLGLMIIVRTVIRNLRRYTGGATGLSGVPYYTDVLWVYACAVLAVYVIWRLVRSDFGRAMLALREDETAAQAIGVSPSRYRLLAFVVGAFFAGVAGALWAHLVGIINPESFSYTMTFRVVVMVVLGGTGSITGSVLGAIIMTLLPEGLRILEGGTVIFGYRLPLLTGVSQLVIGGMLILLMIFRPQGILGQRELSWAMLGLRRGGGMLHQKGAQVLESAPRAEVAAGALPKEEKNA